jgi:hypothetical protein
MFLNTSIAVHAYFSHLLAAPLPTVSTICLPYAVRFVFDLFHDVRPVRRTRFFGAAILAPCLNSPGERSARGMRISYTPRMMQKQYESEPQD